ncbi:MAG: aminotransferase class V-fold PLP-dependent enzyme [Chloroflexi bacterium]|nr:aminotransferase class V-fold PLP-dependent enzyme [Chloroflexota bacterium]
MREVYLDNGSATPIDIRVHEAMSPYCRELFGNPVSFGDRGNRASDAIEEARSQVGSLINAPENEIIFTSCGTESNNMAIKGLAVARRGRGRHVIISSIEHFSVLHPARTLEKFGFEVTYLPVDEYGLVDPDQVKKNIRQDTTLVSVMHANMEVGTIQPLKEIAEVVKESGAVFHTDAIATTGVIPVDVQELGIDCLSLAANEFYGPTGAAALWLRRGIQIIPMLEGGVQESDKRSGTHNVPGVVGLGKAAELAQQDMQSRNEQITKLRDRLREGLQEKIKHINLTGHPTQRLPGNVSLCVNFIEGEAMLAFLENQGIAAASGSACTSKMLKSSHVLNAMGYPPEIAQGSLLFTIGAENTDEDINYVIESFPPIVERLRQISPLYDKYLKSQKGGK